MFKAQLYTNGSNSRDTFTSNDFFLVFKGGPHTLLDMYLRTANFKQNVLATLGAFQK